MAFTPLGYINHSGSGPTGAVDTTGAKLIVIHTIDHATAPVDNIGGESNTYLAGVNNAGSKIWYCINPIVGPGHTFDPGTADFSFIEVEYFGASGAVSVDGTATQGSGSGSAQPGSQTPSQDNCLIVTGGGSFTTSGTPSVGSGFTQTAALGFVGGTSYGGGLGYKIQTAAAAVNPTWTWGGTVYATMIVFKETISPPPTITDSDPLPNVTQGVAATYDFNSTGGTGSVTWSKVGGTASVSVNSAGHRTDSDTSAGPRTVTIRATDSLGNYSEKTLTWTVVPFSWPSQSELVPKADVVFWHEALRLGLPDAANVTSVPDLGQNAIGLTCGSSNPTYDADGANGKPAVHFAGTSNPLVSEEGIGLPTIKHLFIVASYQDATFSGNNGLIGPITSGDNLLLGNGSSSTKFQSSSYGSGYTYRKGGVKLAESNQQAPMSNAVRIIEVIHTGGLSLDDVQIGKHLGSSDKWKGLWVMDIAYGRVLTDEERRGIYEYIARVAWIWEQDASGNDVWPFDADWGRMLPRTKRVLSSSAVSGATKSRTKSSKKRSLDAKFTDRDQLEFDAADKFWDEHYPGTSVVYRDRATDPARDVVITITSDLDDQTDDYNGVSYRLQGMEV